MKKHIVDNLTGLLGVLFVATSVNLAMPRVAQARNINNTTRTSVNRNVDVDVDVDRHYHPVARAAATTAAVTTAAVVTSAVVGSMVRTLPPACSAVVVNGLTYQNCGGAWYQPQYAGTSVTYVVVNPPQ